MEDTVWPSWAGLAAKTGAAACKQVQAARGLRKTRRADMPPTPSPPAAPHSNIVQGSKEQKAALDLLLAPENAGQARPHLVAACAFALG